MTALSQTIFDRYQVRKTKAQKQDFIDLLQSHFPELQVQEGGFPRNRNLIIGNIESANVIFTAHYDTCARLPFPNFITPKKPLLAFLYALLMIIPLFIAVFLINIALNLITDNYWIHYFVSLVSYFGLLIFMMAGPANKHTANDNTSGVATILQMLETIPEDLRNNAAFVLFDLEEAGLFGSSAFYSKHKKAMQDKLLINFDCVSDGDHLLFCIKKKARKWMPQLENAFASTGDKTVELCTKGFFYPSDQANFPCGIGVAALKKNRFGLLYMDRIHTKRDTVFQEENIALLARSSLLLTQILGKN